MLTLKPNGERLAIPHLAAIYEPMPEAVRVTQVGTGIVFRKNDRHILITAKHVLVGESGTENPGEKALVLCGRRRQFGDLANPNMYSSPLFDMAAFELDGGDAEWGFDPSCVASSGPEPTSITIAGYLARDFKRSTAEGVLRPAPFLYSNVAADAGDGYVGLRYPRKRNRNAVSGVRSTVPVPTGISGGAMLDSDALKAGEVRIVGLFTEYPNERGLALGETSTKIAALLDLM
jgi:hypothetical protein